MMKNQQAQKKTVQVAVLPKKLRQKKEIGTVIDQQKFTSVFKE